jgi:hypothetical protein
MSLPKVGGSLNRGKSNIHPMIRRVGYVTALSVKDPPLLVMHIDRSEIKCWQPEKKKI